MDSVENPFAPGAGTRPPQLAGRDSVIGNANIALRRIRSGKHARSQILLGLRGVGKTVLLNHTAEIAEGEGYLVSLIEAQEGARLVDMLAPKLRILLFRLSAMEKARVLANRAMSSLRSFAGAFKITFGDLVGVEVDPGDAATGDLEEDLSHLLHLTAQTAKAAGKPVAIFIDEVQYLRREELSPLIAALHRVSQSTLPLILFSAGLPQLAALAGEAKSYAERLFEFPAIGPLNPEESKTALRNPIRQAGADITEGALNLIIAQTEGYPYFLQEWGYRCWEAAPSSPIREEDVKRASAQALEHLDTGFFRVRLDRLTPREQDYLRAMAELGPGPHRSGDISAVLNLDVTMAGALRTGLIRKGMIYSPEHGQTAFTVPLFDAFMRRRMPKWKAPAKGKRRK